MTRIQMGTHVRVRIVGIKYDPTEVVSGLGCVRVHRRSESVEI